MADLEAQMWAVDTRLNEAIRLGNEAAFDAAWTDLLGLLDERNAGTAHNTGE